MARYENEEAVELAYEADVDAARFFYESAVRDAQWVRREPPI